MTNGIRKQNFDGRHGPARNFFGLVGSSFFRISAFGFRIYSLTVCTGNADSGTFLFVSPK